MAPSCLGRRGEHEAFVDQRYSRGHVMRFDGGVEVAGSSSPLSVPLPMSVAKLLRSSNSGELTRRVTLRSLRLPLQTTYFRRVNAHAERPCFFGDSM